MRVSILALLAGVLLPGSAMAQQNVPATADAPPSKVEAPKVEAPASDPIIVTGRPLPSKDEIRAMTRAITPIDPSGDPLARFNDPVCLGSIGLDRATLEAIGDRFAADAEQAGLKLAGSGCKPNVLVLFVDHVDSEVDTLVKRKWWVFGDRSPAEIRTIVHERGPVRAWSNSETRARDGERIGYDRFLQIASASRIVAPIRKDTLAAVVLVERSAAIGKTTYQVADYLAMRALAGVRPRQTNSKDTILGLFAADAQEAPAELTAFDRGYLRGLYAGQANAFASTTQGQIVRTILKAKDAEVAGSGTP
ncbi:hypothetical protein [Sphingomonas sp.]|uniref:hypothetical protein n=1 Tax=Sphingomonas sp. TaxID=28214 RepID=UPI002FD8B145